jgi:hypothetical protein
MMVQEYMFELDRPTTARVVPMENECLDGFSATNEEEARLHLTKPPNAMPASERCLSQPRASLWDL